ncbi:MAG: Na+/H+ antiporter NhaA, partial [Acidimicrobiia bacterium]
MHRRLGMAATVTALAWANSPWSSSYEHLWHTEAALRFGATNSSSTCGTGSTMV